MILFVLYNTMFMYSDNKKKTKKIYVCIQKLENHTVKRQIRKRQRKPQ